MVDAIWQQKKFTESISYLNTVWELSVCREKSLAIELKYLAEPLEDAHGTPVEKHCLSVITLNQTDLRFDHRKQMIRNTKTTFPFILSKKLRMTGLDKTT